MRADIHTGDKYDWEIEAYNTTAFKRSEYKVKAWWIEDGEQINRWNDKVCQEVAEEINRRGLVDGPTATLTLLHKNIAQNEVDAAQQIANTQLRRMDYNATIDLAKSTIVKWTKQRLALQRALRAGRIELVNYHDSVKADEIAWFVSERRIRVLMPKAVEVVQDWTARQRFKYALRFDIDWKQLGYAQTNFVRTWKGLNYAKGEEFYFLYTEYISEFMARFRNYIRVQGYKHDIPFTLTDLTPLCDI